MPCGPSPPAAERLLAAIDPAAARRSTLLQAAGGAGVLSPTPLWFSISFSKAPLILAFVSGRPEPFGAGCDTVDTKTLSHDGSLHTDTKHQAFVHKLLGFFFLPSCFVTIG